MYRHPPPDVERAMAELRDQLIADKGGREQLSTAELLLIDLTVAAAAKHQRRALPAHAALAGGQAASPCLAGGAVGRDTGKSYQ
jgi:hypothetical protein